MSPRRCWLWMPLLGSLVGCTPAAPTGGAAPAPKAAAAGKKPSAASAKPSAGQTGATAADAGNSDSYVYETEGRRDPFVSVLGRGTVDVRPATSRKGEGLAGLAVNEIAVRGLVLIGGARVAMVQGPDGRTYNVRAGDKFLDGTVKSIVPEGLVIVQDVNDPLSTTKQREIRKLLRSLEESKQ